MGNHHNNNKKRLLSKKKRQKRLMLALVSVGVLLLVIAAAFMIRGAMGPKYELVDENHPVATLTMQNGKKIIIVTELYQENTGTSVTYNGASLAEQICQAKGISTDNMIYIECNPDTNSKLSFYDEEFFEVTFGRDADGHLCSPQYRQLTPEIIKEYGI